MVHTGSIVQGSRTQRLGTKGHWEKGLIIVKCCQITVRNANNSMLLGYNNSDKHKSSLAKLQYIGLFTSTFCDLQMPRYGR